MGILIYGIAEASTAYLITKITDPPPPPGKAALFAEGQVNWRNKHEFLTMPLSLIDAVESMEAKEARAEKRRLSQVTPTKKFT